MASNGEDISNNLDEIRKALAQIVHELKRMNDLTQFSERA